MNKIQLTEEELANTYVGGAVTLSTVMAILAISITMVICYRIYKSKSGKTKIPGGFSFEWK